MQAGSKRKEDAQRMEGRQTGQGWSLQQVQNVPQWEQLGKAKERWLESERRLELELVMWAHRVMGQQLWIILYLPGATCPAWGPRKS